MEESLYLKVSAAGLLSAVFITLYPKSSMMGSSVTSDGFYCQFHLFKGGESIELSQIEDVMRLWIQQNVEIRLLEMVRFSAEEYLRFSKQFKTLEALSSRDDPSICFLDVGSIRVIAPDLIPCNLSRVAPLEKLRAFRLRKKEIVAPGIIRIYGSVAENKTELKKIMSREILSSHLNFSKNLFILSESCLFFPKATKLLDQLRSLYIKQSAEFHFDQVHTLGFSEEDFWKKSLAFHRELFLEEKKSCRFFEFVTLLSSRGIDFSSGVLDLPVVTRQFFHIFCLRQDLLNEVISSLIFVTKIFKILRFEPRVVLIGRAKSLVLQESLKNCGVVFSTESGSVEGASAIELRCPDVNGRLWPVACIREPIIEGDFVVISGSGALSLERLLALLVEKTQGMLPFDLEIVSEE